MLLPDQKCFEGLSSDNAPAYLRNSYELGSNSLVCAARCSDSNFFTSASNYPSERAGAGLFSDVTVDIFQFALLTGDTRLLTFVYDGERLEYIRERIEAESFVNRID